VARKLIYGGEAMAVRPDGRANPNQLIINEQNKKELGELREILVHAHKERYGSADDLVIGFQLTHSGRFCKPNDKKANGTARGVSTSDTRQKFSVTSDDQIWADCEIERLIECYVAAARSPGTWARISWISSIATAICCMSSSAPARGPANTAEVSRIVPAFMREIIQGIRASGNRIELGVRLSAFDFVPFKPDPTLSQPGKLGLESRKTSRIACHIAMASA